MVHGSYVSPRQLSFGDSSQDGPSVPIRGLNSSPLPITVEAVGLASKEAHLIDSSFSTEVVETILHLLSCRPSVILHSGIQTKKETICYVQSRH